MDFVATTRSMSQKGRRRTLRLPDSHSWGAAFEWLLFFFVFTVQMLKKANHLIPSHAPSLPSRQRRPIIRWEACGFAEFGDSNLWSPNSCSVRRQQGRAGSACYLPTQKLAKISDTTASDASSPVISPSSRRASHSSTAATSSGTPVSMACTARARAA